MKPGDIARLKPEEECDCGAGSFADGSPTRCICACRRSPMTSTIKPENSIRVSCRWCKSTDCTRESSPHCYCLDCGTPLDPCRCRADCQGGNCYQASRS